MLPRLSAYVVRAATALESAEVTIGAGNFALELAQAVALLLPSAQDALRDIFRFRESRNRKVQ